jgi:endo-1,4-beta-xylanase
VRPQRFSEPTYAAILGREFNMVEPEDAMKWEVVHPSKDAYDFSLADRVVAFAAEHHMKVRGHTLVWHHQNPDWLAAERRSPGELAHILEEHIKAVVGHFRGKVMAWDVVNEAFDEHGAGKLRSTIWYDQPGIGLAGQGTAYIEQCFRWAHEADPQALLFYNDAGAEETNVKSDAIYAMVRDFKRRGVPIDGIGMQMHVRGLRLNAHSIAQNIARFAALGVQVHITEMDVAVAVDVDGNPRAEDLRSQAEIYRDVTAACLQYSLCTAIQTWGFTDRYSWIGSHSNHKEGAALLFGRNYQPKTAYYALLDALEKRH